MTKIIKGSAKNGKNHIFGPQFKSGNVSGWKFLDIYNFIF